MSLPAEVIDKRPIVDFSELDQKHELIRDQGKVLATVGLAVLCLVDASSSPAVLNEFIKQSLLPADSLYSLGITPGMHPEKHFFRLLKKPDILVEKQAGSALVRVYDAWLNVYDMAWLAKIYGPEVYDERYADHVFENQGPDNIALVWVLRKRFTTRNALKTIVNTLT